MSNLMEKLKCSNCLKLVSETDNCDKCGKSFCVECLIYYENDEGGGELVFCPKCEQK